PYLVFYEYHPDGRLLRRVEIPAPFPSMVHDFAVTERYIVFPIYPVTMRESRIRETGSPFGWEPDLGTHVVVLSRDHADTEMRWFMHEPCYSFHQMNAFDACDEIVIDMSQYDALPNYYNSRNTARFTRWTIDLSAELVRETVLSPGPMDMPQVDPRR